MISDTFHVVLVPLFLAAWFLLRGLILKTSSLVCFSVRSDSGTLWILPLQLSDLFLLFLSIFSIPREFDGMLPGERQNSLLFLEELLNESVGIDQNQRDCSVLLGSDSMI